VTATSEVAAFLDSQVKAGRVETVGHTAGRRPIRAIPDPSGVNIQHDAGSRRPRHCSTWRRGNAPDLLVESPAHSFSTRVAPLAISEKFSCLRALCKVRTYFAAAALALACALPSAASMVVYDDSGLFALHSTGLTLLDFNSLTGPNTTRSYAGPAGLSISANGRTTTIKGLPSGQALNVYNYPGNPVLNLGTGAVLAGPSNNNNAVNRIDIAVPAGQSAVSLLLNAANNAFTANGGSVRVRFLNGAQALHEETIAIPSAAWVFRGLTSSENITSVQVYGLSGSATAWTRPLMDSFTYGAAAVPEPQYLYWLGIPALWLLRRR
jgi:hypothetical protein